MFLPNGIKSFISDDLSAFGTTVLERKVLDWTADAEAHPPRLEPWDIWGKRQDRLVTSEGWRNLQALGISEGIVAIAYEKRYNEYSRLYQFLKYHIWTGSCANVTCPSAMTDGAASLLSRHTVRDTSCSPDKEVFRAAYDRLVSRDPSKAWTSGQWMTERVGGSDIRNTETLATYARGSKSKVAKRDADGAPLGPWLLNGFKWFSSATDANMAIVLAKSPDGGISAFYAPTQRTVSGNLEAEDSSLVTTTLNGITIQRLKSKLGTRPLPTAELSLTNTRAYMIGSPGQGVKEISAILNITRIHNAVTACGLWGRGLAISRAFARVRSVRGRSLMDLQPHVRTMAKEHVEYRANMLMTFFVVALLGVSEQVSPKSRHDSPNSASSAADLVPSGYAVVLLLRVLTPVLKALTAKAAIAGLAECMESLGGVGYLDSSSPLDISTNIARLYRDANVLSIWEGTTDVMADDTIRVLKGKEGHNAMAALGHWVDTILDKWRIAKSIAIEAYSEAVSLLWRRWTTEVRRKDAEELLVRGRNVMEDLGWLVSAILLVEDAIRDADDVSSAVAMRWVLKKGDIKRMGPLTWTEEAGLDRKIVFGESDMAVAKL